MACCDAPDRSDTNVAATVNTDEIAPDKKAATGGLMLDLSSVLTIDMLHLGLGLEVIANQINGSSRMFGLQ